MKTAITLAALALAGASFGAQAAESGARGERLRKADANGDGLVSREEAKAAPRLAKHFDEIDANKDGQVSPEEMRAFHEKRHAEHWKRLDANGDGQVSKAEAQASAPRLFENFESLDANKDGQLSREELQAARGARGRK